LQRRRVLKRGAEDAADVASRRRRPVLQSPLSPCGRGTGRGDSRGSAKKPRSGRDAKPGTATCTAQPPCAYLRQTHLRLPAPNPSPCPSPTRGEGALLRRPADALFRYCPLSCRRNTAAGRRDRQSRGGFSIPGPLRLAYDAAVAGSPRRGNP
jgi:hypothetical protein